MAADFGTRLDTIHYRHRYVEYNRMVVVHPIALDFLKRCLTIFDNVNTIKMLLQCAAVSLEQELIIVSQQAFDFFFTFLTFVGQCCAF